MRFPARQILLLVAIICSAGVSAYDYVYTHEYEEVPREVEPIPRLSSFVEAATIARSKGVPILIEFSTPWCQYCEALERQILKPLMRDDTYRDAIVLKKLEVDTYSTIIGFDGKPYRSDQISRMYNVDLYPTLVFFDASGREISQRIVGITVLEYVAGELEIAIDRAMKASVEGL
jgi:thioredoxin-related protein